MNYPFNPSQAQGDYFFTVRAVRASGDDIENSSAFTKNVFPSASLTADPTSGYRPLFVDFNGSQSSDQDGNIATYKFNPGDGATPYQHGSPSQGHTYTAAGQYTASLEVFDGLDWSQPANVAINVTNPPPPSITINSSGINGTSSWVNFQLNVGAWIDVWVKDGSGAVIAQLRNSGTDHLDGGVPLNVNYNFSQAQAQGPYYFHVRATNEGGQDNENTPNFIKNIQPVAVLSANPTTGDAPLAVTFNVASSNDVDGSSSSLTYILNYGDGSPVANGACGPNPQQVHTYNSANTYSASLTVNDGYASSAPYITAINVETTPPWQVVFEDNFSNSYLGNGWAYEGSAPLSISGGVLQINKTTTNTGYIYRSTGEISGSSSKWAVQWRGRIENLSTYFWTVNFGASTPPYWLDPGLQASGNSNFYGYGGFQSFNTSAINDWHEYRVEGDGSQLKLLVDGIQKSISSSSFRPSRINLGDWYNGDALHHGNYYLDYVRFELYQEGGGGGSQDPPEINITSTEINSGISAWVTFQLNVGAWIDVWIRNSSGSFIQQLKSSGSDYLNANTPLSVNYTFSQSQAQGPYYYRIRAVGDYGTDDENAPSFIKNVSPVAILAANPTFGNPPLPVSFNVASSYDVDFNSGSLGYTLNYGEGTPATGTVGSNPNQSHTYNSNGNFYSSLTVNDGYANSNPHTVQISVNTIPQETWNTVFLDDFNSFPANGWGFEGNAPWDLSGGVLHIAKTITNYGYIFRTISEFGGSNPWAVEWRGRIENLSTYFWTVNFSTATLPYWLDPGLQADGNSYYYGYGGLQSFYTSAINEWHVYRVEGDGSQLRLKVDGVQKSISSTSFRPSRINLGDWHNGDLHHGNYYLDYVRFELYSGSQLASVSGTDSYESTVKKVKNTTLASSSSEASLSAASTLPEVYWLFQNNPNPFNPSTTINYEIPIGGTSVVELNIFNLRGSHVISLVPSVIKNPGRYSVVWDGHDRHGVRVPSGVYFYRLRAGSYVATRKMIIIK